VVNASVAAIAAILPPKRAVTLLFCISNVSLGTI
jgi:hypothetical protein